MHRARDISAPVFAQVFSEDQEEEDQAVVEIDEPPAYKPPTSRPKLPTASAKSLNRSQNVEKKIEQLAEELANVITIVESGSSLDNPDYDDDEFYGMDHYRGLLD